MRYAPLLAEVAGLALVVVGVLLLAGLAWALLTAGALLVTAVEVRG